MPNILLVEDDADMRSMLCDYFEEADYNVTDVSSAKACFNLLQANSFDVILLDLTLPDEDGLVILRKIVKRTSTPVIVISGRKTDDDKIAGLELGAKDYLGKPFSLKELQIRIKNVLGLPLNDDKKVTDITFHGFLLSMAKRSLSDENNQRIELTQHEFRVLETLVLRRNQVVPREEIVENVSDLDVPENNRAVDISISRLRKKLQDNEKPYRIIQTVRGEGYLLT